MPPVAVSRISKIFSNLSIFKNFRSAGERRKNYVWFWSYTKVLILANAPPLSKCFRGLCNPSSRFYYLRNKRKHRQLLSGWRAASYHWVIHVTWYHWVIPVTTGREHRNRHFTFWLKCIVHFHTWNNVVSFVRINTLLHFRQLNAIIVS
jgi:hypothetical protein